jgi:hypothetical protein
MPFDQPHVMPERISVTAAARAKVFGIGSARTGSTSLAEAMHSFGYRIGNQAEAELLIDDWSVRDFRRIVRYCQNADAFQDVPFSLDYTYIALDQAFPGSQFILTVRGSADEWFESLKRLHTRLAGTGQLPTATDLKEITYREPGWLWKATTLIYGIEDESLLYDRRLFISNYEGHRDAVVEYFRYRKDDLLVLDVSKPTAMQTLGAFLGLAPKTALMPHRNRTM